MPSKKLFKKKIHVTHVPMVCSLLSLGLVIALLLAATIVIWQDQGAWQTRKTAFDQRALTQRMNDLEQKWMRFAGCLAPVATSSSTIGTTEAGLLMPNGPKGSWNTAAATSTAEYRDEKNGVSLKIPYSPSWGDGINRVSPFEINGDGSIMFGPLVYVCEEGCGWTRHFRLSILPSRTLAEAVTKFKNENGLTDIHVKRLDLGGFPVIIFPAPDGMGGTEILEFAGKKFNYLFFPESSKPLDTTLIEQILKTLRSI